MSEIFYRTGISIYAAAVSLASLFHKKASLLRKGQKQSWDIIKSRKTEEVAYTWFHAASLGEFEQGRPVMELLKKNYPGAKILLTFFSPSGYEIRRNYSGADIIVYLPFDTQRNAEKMLNLIPVSKAVFIKYEFWPNYLKALDKRHIPAFSISAIFRPEQIFFKSWGDWYLSRLRLFKHIFVQDEPSAELLKQHGIQEVSIAGDTRFDRVRDVAAQAKTIPVIEQFVSKSTFTLVAGSTWPADEALLLSWLQENPDAKLILVPHEIHDSHIHGIMKIAGEKAVRYSQLKEDIDLSFQCLVLDTMGMLSSVYRYGNLAYIGGGFGVGIHNTLEAAVWEIPVIFGPVYHKFREAKGLIDAGGAKSVSDINQLKEAVNFFRKHPEAEQKAGDYVVANTGATELIIKELCR